MKIIIKSDEINKNITIPNIIVLNGIVSKIISKNIPDDIDQKLALDMLKVLKDYLKKHPKFKLLEVESDDTYIKIVL